MASRERSRSQPPLPLLLPWEAAGAVVVASSGSGAVAGSVARMASAASLSHGILGSALLRPWSSCCDHARIEVSLLATHMCASGSGTSTCRSSGSGTSSNGSGVGSEQQHQHQQQEHHAAGSAPVPAPAVGGSNVELVRERLVARGERGSIEKHW